MKRILAIISFIGLCFGANGQQADSLKMKLETAVSLRDKMDITAKLMSVAINSEEKDAYAHSLDSMINLSTDPFDISEAYLTVGQYYNEKSYYEVAETYYQKALKEIEKTGKTDREGVIARIQASRGLNFISQTNFSPAAELLCEAGNYFDKIKDYDALVRVYSGLANIYHSQRTTMKAGPEKDAFIQKSNELFEKTMALIPKLKDDMSKVQCYSAYSNYLDNNDRLDEALLYIDKMDSVSRKINYTTGLITSLGQRGMIEERKGNFRKAVEYYMKCCETAVKDRKYSFAAKSISNAAFLSYVQGWKADAKRYAEMGIGLTDTIKIDDQRWRHLDVLSMIAENDGKYKEALDLRNQCIDIYINANNEKNNNQINHYAARFESALKDNEIKQMQHDADLLRYKTRQRGQLFGLSLVILVLSVSAFLIIIIYRRRLEKKQKELADRKIYELEQEKQLIATQSVLDGETAERTRLARDLHDGLGGMLSVIKLNLKDVKNYAILESEDIEHFNNARDMLDRSIKELRRVAHHMMPETLLRYGLKTSLEDFCTSIPAAEFHYYGDGSRFDSKVEIMLYRCVHELVNNALKHSGADKINVQLIRDNDRVSLTVQDNGCGFDADTPAEGTGLGNIRNRVESCNGKMNIFSSPDKGTEVYIEIILP